MITFSFSPRRWSTIPLIAPSVRTLVVSWKDAAARKLSVLSDVRVIPSSSGVARAGSPPSASTFPLMSSNTNRSTGSPGSSSVSPGWSTRTFRSICLMMISMCLSLMLTPCVR